MHRSLMAGLLLATVATASQAQETPTERRDAVNNPVVGVMGGGIDGQATRLLWDIKEVTDSDGTDGNRVLAILGGGSVKNINDLLYLRGVDAAIVQNDVLQFYETLGLEKDLNKRIAYIAPLGVQTAHLLTKKNVRNIRELQGKKVNFGRETSGSTVSASQIFDYLNIAVEATQMPHRKALQALNAGIIDAMFWMAPQPVDLLVGIDPGSDLHFLPIEAKDVGSELYQRHAILSENYPFMAQGQDINSVSTITVLAAYNWAADAPRRKKVQRFADTLEEKFGELKSPGHHPSFRDVDFEQDIPGNWMRF